MKFIVKNEHPAKINTACLVIPVFAKKLSVSGQLLDKATGGVLKKRIKNGDVSSKPSSITWLYDLPGIKAARVMLVGCGPEESVDAARYKTINQDVTIALENSAATEACTFIPQITNKHLDQSMLIRLAIIASGNAVYSFTKYKSKPDKNPKPLRKLTLVVKRATQITASRKLAKQASGIVSGMAYAKTLANMPANDCTPSMLASEARKLKKIWPKLKLKILSEKDMQELGMNSLLSVSRGSAQPAKLICMHYNGSDTSHSAKTDSKPTVLVGKGITFDTGGISLKPGAKMDEMKYDMGGAASVFGTMLACMESGLKVNLVGIIAAAENMPGSMATRPGDIVKSMSGQTIEILNTDAEGRLVLCDALTYAAKYKPEMVVDIATLTGACIVALGHQRSGMMSNDDALAKLLENAADSIHDPLWRLPLGEEYNKQLHSNFADMGNIGSPGAGTITAGCFLSRFTKDYRWAHLDIAGTAWVSGAKKGATGRPVPLLTEFLIRIESQK